MTKMGSGAKLGGAIAVLALTINVSGCGTETEGETESVTSALASNVPYVSGSIKVDNGTAGDAAIFNGKAYFAYLHNQQLSMVIENDLSNDGLQSPTFLGIPTSGSVVLGPGLALLPNENILYLFFITSNNSVSNNMWVMSSTNGTLWSTPVLVDDTHLWVTPPAATQFADQPNVFAGYNTSSGTAIGQFTWTGTVRPPIVNHGSSSGTRPTATAWGATLYLAWNSGGTIFTKHYNQRDGWSPLTSLPAKSGIPALFPLQNISLEIVFRGNDSHIYHASSTDGVTYGNSTQDPASTTNHAAIPFTSASFTTNWVFYVGVNNELFTVIE